MNIDRELQKLLQENRDEEMPDIASAYESYNREMKFYDVISSGDTEYLELIFSGATNNGKKARHGTLTSDAIRNRRYHIIICAALVSRFCIQEGMDVTTSYTMSDIYIQHLDNAKTIDELDTLYYAMCRDYCRKMREMQKQNIGSKHIILAIDYIRENIQHNLTIDTIANALNLNTSYLSKLFKQEMNISLSQYIRSEKIKIACSMLRHTDESSLDIASYLGFSSQSHFIQVFKKHKGITPEDYRKKNFHVGLGPKRKRRGKTK